MPPYRYALVVPLALAGLRALRGALPGNARGQAVAALVGGAWCLALATLALLWPP